MAKEGHKRETRKSYQQYLNELTEPNNMEGDSPTIDDNSIRRSRRTPVPKRNFKLIDDYESKNTPKKKTKTEDKTEQGKSKKSKDDEPHELEIKTADLIKTEEEEERPSKGETNLHNNTAEEQPELEEKPARKSSRTPKPKTFQDSISLPLIKRSQVKKEPVDDESVEQVFISTSEAVKQRRKSLPTNDNKEAKQLKQTSPRKRKSSTSHEISTNKKEVKKPAKEQNVSTIITKDKLENKQPAVLIKQEEQSDLSQSSNQSQDDTPNKKKSKKSFQYESYVTTGSKVYISEDAEVKLDESTPIDATPSSVSKTTKKKKKATKKKICNSKISKKKSGNEKTGKLIVSFKKKNLHQGDSASKSKKNQLKNSTESTDTIAEQIPKEQTLANPSNALLCNEGKKKKSKKKSKKKLDSTNQRVVDVKTFDLDDTTILKVKKKKIYKKRNNVKVLVRIIKNHCNRNGEIVKSETVIVDSVPVDENADTNVSNEEIDEEKDWIKEEMFSPGNSLDVSLEENNDMDFENLHVNSDTTPKSSSFTGNSGVAKSKNKIEKKKQLIPKKKKQLSRPANKNVTVGGKVVGKTTKGMKKTGVSGLDESKTTTTKIAEVIPSKPVHTTYSEPKNAYNLFCRKYRPLVVQEHPKADFAEISRRLAALWNSASLAERREHRNRFIEMQNATRIKLNRLSRTATSRWSDTDLKFVKKAIIDKEPYSLPKYPLKNLQPVDFAAHLQLLGDSLSVIGGALEQQAAMTVHGAMTVLLDSMLCSLAPLLFLTSYIPEMNTIEEEQQSRTLDNVGYILPGL